MLAACGPDAPPPPEVSEGQAALEWVTSQETEALASVPDVRERAVHYQEQIRRGWLTPEEGAEAFREWVEWWERRNPELAAAARAAADSTGARD